MTFLFVLTVPSGVLAQPAVGLGEVSTTLGTMDYTESNFLVDTVRSGRYRPSDPYRTHGTWVAAQMQYAFTNWYATAARIRAGSMRRGPPTVVPSEEHVTAGDHASLDPQLGDPPAGGSVAALMRFFPDRIAIDFGATLALGSFRPRWNGDGLIYVRRCKSCYAGQEGFEGLAMVPTLRVSRTGRGFVFALGTGEGFVRTNEPGPIEALLGWRSKNFDVLAGLARGLASRADFAVRDGWWLGMDVSAKPWGKSVADYEGAIWIFALSIERRFNDFSLL